MIINYHKVKERLYLFNTLTQKKELFRPLSPPQVRMYTCGPTVYDYVHIGNWRTYVLADVLRRVLDYWGYQVDYIMNITDVGHLTGDNLGDADQGEDRIEKGARREGKSVWEIAAYYTEDFIEGLGKLNFIPPRLLVKATDHIEEQIALVKQLEEKGFTYRIDDGIYFDVQAYEKAGFHYGELSPLQQRRKGARVEFNPQKKDPRDFALWKFSPTDVKREMEWDSPWGKGFPGWHIECSAMSMRYLGEQFDLHLGGEDLKNIHHPNEIAQAQAATGKAPFVRYWVHGAFLQVDGGRMGKSQGNAYTLHDLEERGFSPLDLRYFYFTAHYRSPLNFTWEALRAARQGRLKLKERLAALAAKERSLKEKEVVEVKEGEKKLKQFWANDLDVPGALAFFWKLVREKDLSPQALYYLAGKMDQVLGLNLLEEEKLFLSPAEVSPRVRQLIERREKLRAQQDFVAADQLRKEIEEEGLELIDTPQGPRLRRR